eukprot:g36.t1
MPSMRRSKGGGGGKYAALRQGGGGQDAEYRQRVAKGAVICCVVLFVGVLIFGPSSTRDDYSGIGSLRSESVKEPLSVLTWNIAAINNNPFEYWISYENLEYEKLMMSVQNLIESPKEHDTLVSDIFTESMFDELRAEMLNFGWDRENIDVTEKMWKEDYSTRRSVSQFLKDPEIGIKRLVSMPDRVTNTINLNAGTGGTHPRAYRPAVHNCFGGNLGSVAEWWRKWKQFMFRDRLNVSGSDATQYPAEKLSKIKRAKYPAVTETEEQVSLPLQTLMLAVFDAVLVHTMLTVSSTPNAWQSVRRDICKALNLRKNDRILEILSSTYKDRHVTFLQEVAGAFLPQAQRVFSGSHSVVVSASLNRKRDQNSVILLRDDYFQISTVVEMTQTVQDALAQLNPQRSVPVAQGDILAITVQSRRGEQYFLASFHGDTNGLATIPVVDAVTYVHRNMPPGTILLFGLDANTYEHAIAGKQQDVLEFARHYVARGLTSCWGDTPDPTEHTTYNARTFLQPQLNKAARRDQLVEKGDVNPKDFILFDRGIFRVQSVRKDNTGKKRYIERMVFPTMEFPSDHGALSAELVRTGN